MKNARCFFPPGDQTVHPKTPFRLFVYAALANLCGHVTKGRKSTLRSALLYDLRIVTPFEPPPSAQKATKDR